MLLHAYLCIHTHTNTHTHTHTHTQMRKEDWEDREEEIQRLSRNFDNRLAIQRQLLVEAHESEMEATQQVSSWDG
jgi:DNA-binding transcriptional regulator/RsmH inhibitor MraZ